MRELDPAAVADIIDRVCARETFADVTPVWDKTPDDTEVRISGDMAPFLRNLYRNRNHSHNVVPIL